MKVLHIDAMRTWRGGERQVFYLACGLRQRGIGVSVVCQPGSALSRRLVSAGVSVFEVPMHCEADAAAVWKIAGEIRRGKFDIVHMHDSHSHWLGACAALVAGRPKRVVSRRVDFGIKRHGFGLGIFKYRYFADMFIAVSDAVGRSLVRDGVTGDMVCRVYSGVELPQDGGRGRDSLRESLGVESGCVLVGNVGNLVWHKGHNVIVEAASLVVKGFPDVRFVIIGGGPLYNTLAAQVRRLGLQDYVKLPGFLENARDFILAFDIFVTGSIMEGLGTSLLDALAAARPVAASAAGGIPEVIVHNRTGLLVPPGNSVALSEAICELIADSRKARTLGLAGRSEVEKSFTVDAMVDGTVAVYGNLLRGRR